MTSLTIRTYPSYFARIPARECILVTIGYTLATLVISLFHCGHRYRAMLNRLQKYIYCVFEYNLTSALQRVCCL